MRRMRELGRGARAALPIVVLTLAGGWSAAAVAQPSLFDQPLSPATPKSALPEPDAVPPAAKPPAVKPAPGKPAAAAKPATDATATDPAAKPATVAAKPKPKPKAPTPGKAIGISNDSTNALTDLEVTADGQVIKLASPLAPGEKAQLKLPVLKSCTVSVSATFASVGSAESSEYNICKDKTLRFTD